MMTPKKFRQKFTYSPTIIQPTPTPQNNYKIPPPDPPPPLQHQLPHPLSSIHSTLSYQTSTSPFTPNTNHQQLPSSISTILPYQFPAQTPSHHLYNSTTWPSNSTLPISNAAILQFWTNYSQHKPLSTGPFSPKRTSSSFDPSHHTFTSAFRPRNIPSRTWHDGTGS